MTNFNPYYQLNTKPYPQPGIIWVQGAEQAKAYQMLPNTSVVLMDNENEGIFYIKTSDNVGMCSIRTFKYAEVTQTTPVNIDVSQFITREELTQILDKRLKINGKQSIQSNKQSNNTTGKQLSD